MSRETRAIRATGTLSWPGLLCSNDRSISSLKQSTSCRISICRAMNQFRCTRRRCVKERISGERFLRQLDCKWSMKWGRSSAMRTVEVPCCSQLRLRNHPNFTVKMRYKQPWRKFAVVSICFSHDCIAKGIHSVDSSCLQKAGSIRERVHGCGPSGEVEQKSERSETSRRICPIPQARMTHECFSLQIMSHMLSSSSLSVAMLHCSRKSKIVSTSTRDGFTV